LRGIPAEQAALFEYELQASTLVPTMRKPFDVLAEGLLLRNNRGDRTAIELFVAGVQGWEAGLRRNLARATVVDR
jgi:hypothetical protein